jgi:hypothetical protein
MSSTTGVAGLQASSKVQKKGKATDLLDLTETV